jgi:hypothetical protein
VGQLWGRASGLCCEKSIVMMVRYGRGAGSVNGLLVDGCGKV